MLGLASFSSLLLILCGTVDAAEEAETPCSNGYLAKIFDIAPDCFSACEGSCAAVEKVMIAFYTGDGKNSAKEVLCSNLEPFECFLEPGVIESCAPLFDYAESFGHVFPKSLDEVAKSCSSLQSSLWTWPTSGGALRGHMLQQASAKSLCIQGSAFQLYRRAPECFAPCERSCRAVSSAVRAFLTPGGARSAQRTICRNIDAFQCFVFDGAADACEPILNQSRSVGFPFPASIEELHQSCLDAE